MGQNFCSEISEDYVELHVKDNKETAEKMYKKYFKNGEFVKPTIDSKKTLNEMFKKQGEIYTKKYGNGSV
ncbi:hypothetical protein AVT43_gp64 [Polaribacter phage P12002L]|uniref:Uncharacterized protein n=2 Tax=Incheonvirus TaxID=2976977 RepID=A0A0F7ILL8_9CAUD|nr:hypothetical protein AVT42_gp66 [Polaribacter phage P12002S]YP_009209724.1 hypothetical protein AVT43_gp64 [Polaribacter phage P12002L]AKG94238.1 hypothetical protein P12002L_0064 [Polaribacter phage P12002L]AKG94322.1 hypothetical protein P12002S_0066 [Polaribacter phage P12002S]